MNKRFSILVLGDGSVNIRILMSALKVKYDVLTALNVHKAISRVKEHTSDLILLDVMMPEQNCFDVCSIIKSDEVCADIPVIFLTALGTNDGKLQGLECGGIDCLTKPINYDLLRLQVRNHIALKERNDLIKELRDLLARQEEKLETTLARVKQL